MSFDTVKRVWDARAGEWDRQVRRSDNRFARRTKQIAGMIGRHMTVGTALDVGCATGELSRCLQAMGFDVHGCDLSPAMVQRAIELSRETMADAHARFRVSTNDAIPFDRTFDLVTAIGVTPYVPDPAAFMRRLADRLNPGGYLVASTTHAMSLYTLIWMFKALFCNIPSLGVLRTWRRLWLTGIPSGGHIDHRVTQRDHSPGGFDRMAGEVGLQRVDAFDLYMLPAFDRRPLDRGALGKWWARQLGWTHCGMYRKPSADNEPSSRLTGFGEE